MIKQVEAVPVIDGSPAVPKASPKVVVDDVTLDPRVTVEGKGWYLVDGERCHGLKKVSKALAALGVHGA